MAITDIVTTIAGILSISVLSIPIYESRFSRVGEFIYIGIVGAIAIWANVTALWTTNFLPLLDGNWVLIIATLGGIVILLRPFVRQLRVVALLPLALAFGYQIGVGVGGGIVAQIWKQVMSTSKIVTSGAPIDIVTSLLIVVIVATVLLSFITTFENKPLKWAQDAGRWFLLIAFASGFGQWMVGRFGLLAARFQYLIYVWLEIPPMW
jgi:hypothetical protein